MIKFKNYQNQLEHPFVFTWDSEATNLKVKYGNIEGEKTEQLSLHMANSCGYLVTHSFNPERNKYYSFDGDESILEMMKHMSKMAYRLIKELKDENVPMCMTDDDILDFKNCKFCHICHEPFKGDGYCIAIV